MYKVSVNQEPELEIDIKDGQYFIDQRAAQFDVVANRDGTYHALYEGKSYTIKVRESHGDYLGLEINNKIAETRVKNELEDLISKMGMDKLSGALMNELKAPMPGLVLKIMVKEGDEVKKGDSLIVLEAMKMENNIKAMGDGKVGSIQVNAGDKVDKNQLLISFT